jgi:DNA polymerase-3 subunit epsilon
MKNFLRDLPVLVVDCQTTGNHPRNSHVLEIGWMSTRAGGPVGRAFEMKKILMLHLPSGQEIPKAVRKLTGIERIPMDAAVAPEAAWQQLAADARLVAGDRIEAGCPAVIHFARFETVFLEALHREHGGGACFPLNIVCTHQIAARLLPDLPRKGLRAVAGYFGYSVPMAKRCGAHLEATAAIWRCLVPLMEQEAGITTWDQLRQWLARQKKPLRQVARTYPMPRSARLNLPDAPGIYRFLRSNGDVLYIGKARSLRRRVNSYFQGRRRHSEKNLEMLSQAAGLDYVRTHSAVEAAYLESMEIKTGKPPYNDALAAGRRRLLFFSPDFGACAEQPDALYRLGPVPSGELFSTFRMLGQWLEGRLEDSPEHLAPQLLGMSVDYSPAGDCLTAGLEMFRSRFDHFLRRQGVWRGLVSIGRLAWKERMDERMLPDDPEEASDDNSGGRVSDEDSGFVWSPEAVARVVASRLRNGAHLLRRARWLTMLTESSVAWRDSEAPSEKRQVLMFRHGRLIERLYVKKTGDPPVPPEHALPLDRRKVHLDLAVYDGLRVLTTELRRLVAENRRPVVRLNPRIVLGPDQLRVLLKWI